jgi:alkaline phosphatase
MTRTRAVLGCAAIAAAALAAAVPGVAGAHALSHGPKNVILMISDGWGYHHIAATDYYQHGKTGSQGYERFPVRVAMSTYPLGGSYDPARAWSSFDYVKSGATDSAAASTAMSTGTKTFDGAIGVDSAASDLVHAFQVAERSGRATGVVTSVQFSHATPAGFVAHNVTRNDYAGIAHEMIYDTATDVIMGAGHPCFDANGVSNGCTGTAKYVGGAETWADLTDANGALGADANGDGRRDSWRLVQSRDQFASLARGRTPDRVLGVAQVAQTLQQGRTCTATAVNPLTGVTACTDTAYTVPMTKTVPTLTEMSRAALNVLDNDRDGFALMIEGGAVDWAAHANSLGQLVEEQIEFNAAVEAVVQWIAKNGGWDDNLLVVTGDHECGYLTGVGSDPRWMPVLTRGRGAMPLAEFHSGDHTNGLIPLFAKGEGSAQLARSANEYDPRRGSYLDNSEVGATMRRLLS